MPWIEDAEQKQAVVKRVLEALPEWFGMPDSLAEYVEKAREMPCFVEKEAGEVIGFVSFLQTSECAGEVHVMGILPGWHRKGIGKRLIAACEDRCRKLSLPLLQVKTLDNRVGNAAYLRTYAFYRAMDFLPLEVLPLWDERNPCLLMVKCIHFS